MDAEDASRKMTSNKSVFLSYSRSDRNPCIELKQALELQGLRVLLDETDIPPGAELKKSIRKNITDSDYVVALISQNSLSSPWVIWEITQQLEANPQLLIPCYLDKAFLDDAYESRVKKEIERQQAEIRERIQYELKNNRSTSSLSFRSDSLTDHHKELTRIIEHLRGLNLIELTHANWLRGVSDIYEIITGEDELAVTVVQFPPSTLSAIDIEGRKKELVRQVGAAEIPSAIQDTMDLCNDTHPPLHERILKAVEISASHQILEKKLGVPGLEQEYLREQTEIVRQLLQIIKEIPDYPPDLAA